MITTLLRCADRANDSVAIFRPHCEPKIHRKPWPHHPSLLPPSLPRHAYNLLWPPTGQCEFRELLSEVFLATPSSSSARSVLFVGWGLLVGFDIFLNEDNASEPLDIACDDPSLVDVWCPLGSLSEPISFNRSQGGIDADGDGARSPTNYATAYIDLDWLYGRDEDSAVALRTLELGYLNLTTDELPHLLPDGTWLVSEARRQTWAWDMGLGHVGLERARRAYKRQKQVESRRGRCARDRNTLWTPAWQEGRQTCGHEWGGSTYSPARTVLFLRNGLRLAGLCLCLCSIHTICCRVRPIYLPDRLQTSGQR